MQCKSCILFHVPSFSVYLAKFYCLVIFTLGKANFFQFLLSITDSGCIFTDRKTIKKYGWKKNYVIVTQKLHLAVHKTLIALASTLLYFAARLRFYSCKAMKSSPLLRPFDNLNFVDFPCWKLKKVVCYHVSKFRFENSPTVN